MRLLIVSDIHSNIAALEAVAADAGVVDAVAFIGDAVDYGPYPAPCIAWLKENAAWAVRGNHDEALVHNTGCRCSEHFRAMSIASREMNRRRVSPDDLDYLAALPLTAKFESAGTRFGMAHAAPTDPLYHYLPPDISDKDLSQAMGDFMTEVDVILLGHTHLPVVRQLGAVQVLNPGSVGQPKHGDPRAAYALWTDGAISLHRAEYAVDDTVRALQETDMRTEIVIDLINILRTGT